MKFSTISTYLFNSTHDSTPSFLLNNHAFRNTSSQIGQVRIIDNSWGSITLDIKGQRELFKDVVIFSAEKAAVEWNWAWDKADSMHHHPGIRLKDIKHYLGDRKVDIVILSQGRGHGGQLDNPGPGILEVEAEAVLYLKNQGIDVLILKTAAAIDAYVKIQETDKKIAAFIHTTC